VNLQKGWIRLASFHKYLRLCDLCKELAFGSPDALRQNQDFIQLVRAQHVLPPVPGELTGVGLNTRVAPETFLPTVSGIWYPISIKLVVITFWGVCWGISISSKGNWKLRTQAP